MHLTVFHLFTTRNNQLSMSYSAYLEEHIQSQLTKAIADATIQNPKDAVDYIGNYLLKIVKDDTKTKLVYLEYISNDVAFCQY